MPLLPHRLFVVSKKICYSVVVFLQSVVNFVVVSFQCGEFLQSVVNLSGVVNIIETHQSAVIRNGTVLP